MSPLKGQKRSIPTRVYNPPSLSVVANIEEIADGRIQYASILTTLKSMKKKKKLRKNLMMLNLNSDEAKEKLDEGQKQLDEGKKKLEY